MRRVDQRPSGYARPTAGRASRGDNRMDNRKARVRPPCSWQTLLGMGSDGACTANHSRERVRQAKVMLSEVGAEPMRSKTLKAEIQAKLERQKQLLRRLTNRS